MHLDHKKNNSIVHGGVGAGTKERSGCGVCFLYKSRFRYKIYRIAQPKKKNCNMRGALRLTDVHICRTILDRGIQTKIFALPSRKTRSQ